MMELKEALDLLYAGRKNAAIVAQELGIPLAELQGHFKLYVKSKPIDEKVWKADLEH